LRILYSFERQLQIITGSGSDFDGKSKSTAGAGEAQEGKAENTLIPEFESWLLYTHIV
jgi:hypothetical protein